MKQAAAKKMKQRSAGNPTLSGKRIRLRRVEQKTSQPSLRQIGRQLPAGSKIEKGVNRVGAAVSGQIATPLRRTVTFFYERRRQGARGRSLLFLDSAFSLRC